MYATGPVPGGSTPSHRALAGRAPASPPGRPPVSQTTLADVSSRYIHRHRRRRVRGGGAVLEFAILGLLQQSPMHGYELRKELAQILGGLRSISFGSLYPALKRLHAAG